MRLPNEHATAAIQLLNELWLEVSESTNVDLSDVVLAEQIDLFRLVPKRRLECQRRGLRLATAPLAARLSAATRSASLARLLDTDSGTNQCE